MLYNSYYFCFYHQNFLKKVCSLLLYGEELAAHIEKKRKLKAIKMHLKRTFHFSLNAFGCEGIDLPLTNFAYLTVSPIESPSTISLSISMKCHISVMSFILCKIKIGQEADRASGSAAQGHMHASCVQALPLNNPRVLKCNTLFSGKVWTRLDRCQWHFNGYSMEMSSSSSSLF